MKRLILIGSIIWFSTSWAQLGTTLTKPVPENEFQEIKSILSSVNQSAFRLELNVIGANGVIRKEVLGMKNLAGLQRDGSGKNFMVNNSGAVGRLQQSIPGGSGTGNTPGNTINIPNKGTANQHQENSFGTARVDQTGGNSQSRPGSFRGRSMGNPGGGLTQGKSGEGGGEKPDKGGGEPPKGGTEPPKGGTEPPKGGGEPPKGGTEPPKGGTEPPKGSGEPPKNTGSGGGGLGVGPKPGGEGDKKPEPKAPANSWTGPTLVNTWTGSSGTTGGGSRSGEEEKDKKPTNTYTPSGGLAGNPSLGGQPGPTQQQMGANRMISMPPDFQRGNFFICDICNTGSLGAANLNRLESILAKYQ
jgi:hypothetical protein